MQPYFDPSKDEIWKTTSIFLRIEDDPIFSCEASSTCMKEHAGTFRGINGHGNSGEYRGIQGNKREYREIQDSKVMLVDFFSFF